MKKDRGNVANLMITGIFLLAMTAMMLAYMENAKLIQCKLEVNQIAREYILRMETKGYLDSEDRLSLLWKLQEEGMTQVDLEGTTYEEVGYGEPIVLKISGMLDGTYTVREQKVSTAKY